MLHFRSVILGIFHCRSAIVGDTSLQISYIGGYFTVDQLYWVILHCRSVISEDASLQISYIRGYFTADVISEDASLQISYIGGYFTVDQLYLGILHCRSVILGDTSL